MINTSSFFGHDLIASFKEFTTIQPGAK
jgi:hypothetical protein